MSEREGCKDLVVLTACKDAGQAVEGLLVRHQALRIRPITYDAFKHPQRDPGVFLEAPEFLRPFVHLYGHALVIFDREGTGREGRLLREEMERQLEEKLSASGWSRAAVVVIDPELEAWVWSDSPHVEVELGWEGRNPTLREWLEQKGFLGEGQLKPSRPKEAVEAALCEARRPRSSAIYRKLAESVSVQRGTDPAFVRLRGVLQQWFGLQS